MLKDLFLLEGDSIKQMHKWEINEFYFSSKSPAYDLDMGFLQMYSAFCSPKSFVENIFHELQITKTYAVQ